MTKTIQAFTSANKKLHPRAMPDNHVVDCRNVLFKNFKVKSRPGYAELGSNLPLSGSLLGLREFKRLRSSDRSLVGATEQHAYEYDPVAGTWSQFDDFYNTGTVGQIRTPTDFEAGSTGYISICKVSSAKIAIAYTDVGDSFKGKCIIATLVGTVPTFGTAVEFEAGTTGSISICAVSESKIIIAYVDAGDADKGKCIVATVSGTTPSFGTAVEFEAGATNNCAITAISTIGSTERAIIAFEDIDDSEKGKLVKATITGTVPAISAATDFEAGATSSISITTTTLASHVAIAYVDEGDSNKGKCIMADVSGAISVGSAVEFEAGATKYCSITALSESALAIAYQDDDDSDKGKCILATISGTTPSFGTAIEFESGVTQNIAITALSSSRIVIVYADAGDSDKGKLIIATVSGTIPTFGTAIEFEAGDTDYCSIVALSSTSFSIAYEDDDDSHKGKSVTIDKLNVVGSGATWSVGWPENFYYIKFGTDDIEGVGTPDTWYLITDFINSDECIIESELDTNDLIASGTIYVINQIPVSTAIDYYDSCEIIEGLGADDERQILLTNGADPIKIFDGTTLSTLDMTEDGGSPPIKTARYCAYYYGHVFLGWCNDGTNDLPQSVYYSARGYPTYWSTAGAGYEDLIDNGDEITGLKVFKDRLYALKEDSITEFYYTGVTEPAFTVDQNRVKEKGCKYERTCIVTDRVMIYRGRYNIHVFTGVGDAENIGDDIMPFIEANEDPDYAYKSFAIDVKSESLYRLFFVYSGSTEPDIFVDYNYEEGSWSIGEYADTMTCGGFYNDNFVLGDDSGNVYYIDGSETDDNGTDIDTYIETKDFALTTDRDGNPDYETAFTLIKTILTTETNEGELEISCSVDFGNNWSDAQTIDQDTTDSIYEHVQNWIQFGEQVRFKINNVDGSQHAFEKLQVGFERAGLSTRR